MCNYSRYAFFQSSTLFYFDVKIGGMNGTELYDLRQIPSPYDPFTPDLEKFGAWSASFRVSAVCECCFYDSR